MKDSLKDGFKKIRYSGPIRIEEYYDKHGNQLQQKE